MISYENRLLADYSAGRLFLCIIITYFFPKLGKMSQNLLSGAIVIGALRINLTRSVYTEHTL